MSTELESVVLYAEDDQDDAFFMRRAFAKATLRESLHIATNGAEAITYLEGVGANPLPLFVILDIKMPRVSGLEVLSWIRQSIGKKLPVFMLSSSSQDRDIQQAIDSGANGYLLKPSNAGHLTEALIFMRDFCLKQENGEGNWVCFDGDKPVSIKKSAVQTGKISS